MSAIPAAQPFGAFWASFHEATASGERPGVVQLADREGTFFLPEDGIKLINAVNRVSIFAVNIGGRLREDARSVPGPLTSAEYADFVDRFAQANNCESITFTRDYCLKYAPELARRIRRFLHPLVQQRGIPSPGVNCVFIGGKYRSTWIGLHNDFCDTFVVPAIGPKRMLLWPPGYFSDKPIVAGPGYNGICYGHIDLTPYKPDAVSFQIGPGEVLFIPREWWHYNDLPSDELTMTLSLGIFDNATVEDRVRLATNAACGGIERGNLPEFGLTPGGTISSDLREVNVDPLVDRSLERARYMLRLQTLVAASCGGVLGSGPYRDGPDDVRTTPFRGVEDSPVYLVRSEPLPLVVAGGLLRQVRVIPSIERLIALVNKRNEFRIADVCCGETEDEEELMSLLSWLFSVGCVEY